MSAEPYRPAGAAGRFVALLHRVEDTVLAVLLTGMILLAAAQILLRDVLHAGFTWSAPLLRVMVLWVGLLGALAATRDDKHIAIDVLSRFLPARARLAIQALVDGFAGAVAGLVGWHALRFVHMEYGAGAEAFAGLPSWVLEAVVPMAFILIALRYLLLGAGRVQTLLGRGAGR